MHTVGTIKDVYENRVTIEAGFTADAKQWMLERVEGKEQLVIDIDLQREKRSLSANAYFWKLCDMIAKTIGSDKDTVYLMQLSRYGVFTDIEIIEDAVGTIQNLYRYTDELYTYEAERDTIDGDIEEKTVVCLRCYTGSSHYDTKQMSDLINGTVNDAQELGIDTWTPDEVARALAAWRGR